MFLILELAGPSSRLFEFSLILAFTSIDLSGSLRSFIDNFHPNG